VGDHRRKRARGASRAHRRTLSALDLLLNRRCASPQRTIEIPSEESGQVSIGRRLGSAVRRALSGTSLSTVHEADAHLVSSRVLCTTFDLSKQQPAALEQGLGAWLPRGYQVYAVALQRCRVLPRLRQAIHAHLGEPCDTRKEHMAS
jgi:hypothetical protein